MSIEFLFDISRNLKHVQFNFFDAQTERRELFTNIGKILIGYRRN